MEKIPISEKYALTISEAMSYFNIGRDKLYFLAKEEGNNYNFARSVIACIIQL